MWPRFLASLSASEVLLDSLSGWQALVQRSDAAFSIDFVNNSAAFYGPIVATDPDKLNILVGVWNCESQLTPIFTSISDPSGFFQNLTADINPPPNIGWTDLYNQVQPVNGRP